VDAAGPADETRWWAEDRLAERGVRVTGPWEEPRVRPWSTVQRVATNVGPVWCKSSAPGTAHEPALVAVLAGLSDLVLAPLGVEPDRGWLLLPEGGPTLRHVRPGAEAVAEWERILPAYADLQRASAARVDDLLALGVPDDRPMRLPGLFEALLDDPAVAGGLDEDVLPRLRGAASGLARRCEALASAGIAPTVEHGDLHDGNVLLAADGPVVFDWGDAAVAHPFDSLLVTLRSAAHRLGVQTGDPVLQRLRDAYLEPWTDGHDRQELRSLVDDALHVAPVARALSWRRALTAATPQALAEYGEAVPGWLTELLEPPVA
jgi:hypothetical protein